MFMLFSYCRPLIFHLYSFYGFPNYRCQLKTEQREGEEEARPCAEERLSFPSKAGVLGRDPTAHSAPPAGRSCICSGRPGAGPGAGGRSGGQRMRHTSLRGGQGGPAFWWWERALRPVGKRCSERGPGPGGALRLQQRQVARSTRPGSLRPQRAPQGTAPILEVPAAPAQEPLWPTGLK